MVKDQSLWAASVDGQVVAIPEVHHEWSREPSTFRAKSLSAGEKNCMSFGCSMPVLSVDASWQRFA